MPALGEISHFGEASQAPLVSAFERGMVGGGPTGRVERIDTHLSHVFLAGDRAFKMMRAVAMPFVDFSSVEERGAACRAELEVNSGPGRALYLSAAPIYEADGGFRLGAADDAGFESAVDWVVMMRRFRQEDQFDRLAASGNLSIGLIEAAAAMVALSHRNANPSEIDGEGERGWHNLLATLGATCADGAARSGQGLPWRLLLDRLNAELLTQARFLEARQCAGKVRRGHGDLHLRNLCLFEGRVCAFDAIEFDKRLATTDVLYDLAFLLMDLRHAGLPGHANAALNRYWDEAGEDEAALALLPFFMGLRLGVRMAVALEAGNPEDAKAYLALGLELVGERRHDVVALGGLSGVGKSAVGRALAPKMSGPAGARILRSDVLRKQRLHIPLDAKASADAYAPAARAQIYKDLIQHAFAAAEGAGAILDATFQTPASRELAQARFGARLKAYWLSAPLSVRLTRVAQREHDASDAEVAVAIAQREPVDLAPLWRRLDATRPVEEIVATIVADLCA